MNNKPLISIALTTYNGEKYLNEQLDSILNQTYQHIEIIICDDCSTDNTKTILQNYSLNDTRIKVHLNNKNLGFKKNFEKAISFCSGNFIALSDQDDIWEVTKLEHLLNKIGSYDFICSNALLVTQNNKSMGITMKEVANYHYFPQNNTVLLKRILHDNIVQGSTMLCKKDFLLSCNKIPDVIKFHDWWFALNSLTHNGFTYLDECTIRYRRHQNTETKSIKKCTIISDLKPTIEKEKYLQEIEKYEAKIELYKYLIEKLPFNKKQIEFINSTIRYYKESKAKTFFTYIYFISNCKYIYLDKNIFRNSFRILKKFFGVIYWKLFLRKHYNLS